MAKKRRRRAYDPIIHGMHYHSSSLIFLSLLAAAAHTKVILPKR